MSWDARCRRMSWFCSFRRTRCRAVSRRFGALHGELLHRGVSDSGLSLFGNHLCHNQVSMPAFLTCFEPHCRAQFPIKEVLYNCTTCGGLLEVTYEGGASDAAHCKQVWRERRTSNAPLDQSGVWRYRELIPFLDDHLHVVTLREGNTPLLEGPKAARYGGLDKLTFKHQGFNPTGSFKDNGMTCGATQGLRLRLCPAGLRPPRHNFSPDAAPRA